MWAITPEFVLFPRNYKPPSLNDAETLYNQNRNPKTILKPNAGTNHDALKVKITC